jgi:chromosome segregation ATPase
MSGYLNSARLVFANIGIAGNKLEEMIAGLNPDAAVKVGREERAMLLRTVAEKLAEQQQQATAKQNELDAVNHDLKTKRAAAANITARSQQPGAAMPSEAAVAELVANIKRLKEKAELLEAGLAGKKTAIDFLEHIVADRAEALNSFDNEAEAVRNRMELAKVREEQANLQAEVQGLAGRSASTAGLSALGRAADKAERNAAAAEIVAGATGSKLQKDDVMAGILVEAANGGVPKKSALEELAEMAK